MASASGVTRFWQIPELMQMCFSNLRLDWGDDLQALARCARVSKSVSEIALERLWGEMLGLKPLFQLLTDSVSIHVLVDDLPDADDEDPETVTTYVS